MLHSKRANRNHVLLNLLSVGNQQHVQGSTGLGLPAQLLRNIILYSGLHAHGLSPARQS